MSYVNLFTRIVHKTKKDGGVKLVIKQDSVNTKGQN